MTRILVIDDETTYHQLITKALDGREYQRHFAEDGTSGIARARTIRPDLIITDVMMPDINGYEVTHQLRRDAQFVATPILVLTAQWLLTGAGRLSSARSTPCGYSLMTLTQQLIHWWTQTGHYVTF